MSEKKVSSGTKKAESLERKSKKSESAQNAPAKNSKKSAPVK